MSGEQPSEPELTEVQERARKVKPQYGEGPLVRVAWARNQAEAELIAGFLLEEGVPSLIRRSGGFDVPDFLAAGPRDILVAASGEDVARDALRAVPGEKKGLDPSFSPAPAWVQGMAILLVAVLLVSLGIAVGVSVSR